MGYPSFYTKEMMKIGDVNHAKLKKKLNVPKGWDMHHIDPTLRYEDPWRYTQWNEEDIIVLPHGEHSRIHPIPHTEESKKKLSETNKKRFEDPAEREKTSKATKKGMHDPEKWEKFLCNNSVNGWKHVICVETGEVYRNATEAYRATGFAHIKHVLEGKRERAGGCHWKYLEDMEVENA